jgi:anaerobic C4-dicarboxylate transporter DcuA/anaerobic C4-dicarboxylate transporter DcuB
MAAYLTLLPGSFSLPKILAITIPASIVACLLTSLVQQRIGKELVDDPEFQRRVAAGEVAMPAVLVAAAPQPAPPRTGLAQ